MPVVTRLFAFNAQHNFSLDSASIKAIFAACNDFGCFTIMSVLEIASTDGGKLIRLDVKFGFLPNASWFELKP